MDYPYMLTEDDLFTIIYEETNLTNSMLEVALINYHNYLETNNSLKKYKSKVNKHNHKSNEKI